MVKSQTEDVSQYCQEYKDWRNTSKTNSEETPISFLKIADNFSVSAANLSLGATLHLKQNKKTSLAKIDIFRKCIYLSSLVQFHAVKSFITFSLESFIKMQDWPYLSGRNIQHELSFKITKGGEKFANNQRKYFFFQVSYFSSIFVTPINCKIISKKFVSRQLSWEHIRRL